MKFENISDYLNEARQLAHGLKLFHSQMEEPLPILNNMSEKLSEIIDDVFKELNDNKRPISEKLQKNIEDQFYGIEIYANMEDWKINLIESSNSTIFDDKISEIDDESSQESE
tara:strand:- start:122 stop:460 length:339 start_codon:yes stop_codon:yes gene_type:complete